jgi:hypothetical protein
LGCEVVTARSGTPTTSRATRAARGRPLVTLSLSTEALARLDAIAADRGQSRSGAVEQLVRNARLKADLDRACRTNRRAPVERHLRGTNRESTLLSDAARCREEDATMYAIMQCGELGSERFATADAAQAEADRVNAEADEECGEEIFGDGAASVCEIAV